MSQGILTRVAAKKAAEVCQRFAPGDAARALLRDELSPGQYVDLLLAKEQFVDAVRFVAHALPKREAVWWSCLCVRATLGPKPPDKVGAAVRAAENWVRDGSEDNRRAAQTAAEAAELKTPAGCTAMAAFFSGGSLGPANVPAVPPGEQLTAQTVAGAILLAAVQTEPEKAPAKFRKFVELGLDVASGKNTWAV